MSALSRRMRKIGRMKQKTDLLKDRKKRDQEQADASSKAQENQDKGERNPAEDNLNMEKDPRT